MHNRAETIYRYYHGETLITGVNLSNNLKDYLGDDFNIADMLNELENHPELEYMRDELLKMQRMIGDNAPLVQESASLATRDRCFREECQIKPEDYSSQAYERLLRCAAAKGDLELLQDYLRQPGILDKQDAGRNRRTALHWACLNKRHDCIACLLKEGARFDIPDVHGELAWGYVVNKPSLLKLFKEASDHVLRKHGINATSFFSEPWAKLLRMAVIRGGSQGSLIKISLSERWLRSHRSIRLASSFVSK